MAVRVSERRVDVRVNAACPVRVLSDEGQVLTTGRAANVSENGVLAVVRGCVLARQVLVEITVPSRAEGAIGGQTKTVLYRARVARQQVLGNLVGLGLQLIEKVEQKKAE